LDIIGIIKKPIYSGKPAVGHMLMALAIYNGFVKQLEDKKSFLSKNQ
jgi:hypothetical protein